MFQTAFPERGRQSRLRADMAFNREILCCYFRRLFDDQPPLLNRVRRAQTEISDLVIQQSAYLIDTLELYNLRRPLKQILAE